MNRTHFVCQVKDTLWEGGVRGSGFLWSPLIKKRSRLAHQMMNIQDWLPTLYSVAGEYNITFRYQASLVYILYLLILGGKVSDLPNIDGVDLWSSLSNDQDSPRNLMLHNIDESRNIAALRVGDWKMVKGKK